LDLEQQQATLLTLFENYASLNFLAKANLVGPMQVTWVLVVNFQQPVRMSLLTDSTVNHANFLGREYVLLLAFTSQTHDEAHS
jgi:hypothetical protein